MRYRVYMNLRYLQLSFRHIRLLLESPVINTMSAIINVFQRPSNLSALIMLIQDCYEMLGVVSLSPGMSSDNVRDTFRMSDRAG